MIANSTEAFDLLGGNAERTLDTDLTLLHVTDDVAALRIGTTSILALYGRQAVKITANEHAYMRAVNRFTSARIASHYKLPFITDTNGDRCIYQPGTLLDDHGRVMNPMMPSIERALIARAEEVIDGCRDYAREAVERYDRFHDTFDLPDGYECACLRTDEGRSPHHLMEHLDGELPMVLPRQWRMIITGSNRHPDFNLRDVRRRFSNWMIGFVLPVAIEQVHPNFSYTI